MSTNTVESTPLPGEELDAAKMPGHWLLARMGKRVLRPGGIELTRLLLQGLEITPAKTVVELAPGLGATARLTMLSNPAHYIGVERDEAAAQRVARMLRGEQDRYVVGSAVATGLDAESADIVYVEAMLSMQTATEKSRIVAEAFRVLRPGGLFGIHELGLQPDTLADEIKDAIRMELSNAIHIGARPLTLSEWAEVLHAGGFDVEAPRQRTAPMHLLEPRRVVQDEGLLGAMRIAANLLRMSDARRRVLQMRRVFRRYADHLCAVALIASKPVATPTIPAAIDK
ncbi:MAG: methyltransferase domain-containing protein [Gammaproteobacteria bacterium]|jgi:SAM-dependent methyltransferase|nr:methyltransferase domain-containing protein [Gammaproteobacteria bacterium]